MLSIRERYRQQIIPALQREMGYKNPYEVPRLEKVVVNIGIGKGIKDPKYIETVEDTLKRITGQKPIFTTAKKSISNFKIKKGQKIGMKVTLRGKRMYDFVDKLIHISLPRIRDFRGIPQKAVDESGNLHIGFREHIAFPEIRADEVERIHGVQVTIVTTAENREEALPLFQKFGFPFQKFLKK